MAPTGLRNKARGYLTIINISFLQDPAQRMEGELGGVIEEKEMDGQTCFIWQNMSRHEINITRYEADSLSSVLLQQWVTELCIWGHRWFWLEIALLYETNLYDLASTLQINNHSKIDLHGNDHKNNIHTQDFPTQGEELVKWASQKFGGVTSFTTVQNLKIISWTGTSGKNYLCYLADISLTYFLRQQCFSP